MQLSQHRSTHNKQMNQRPKPAASSWLLCFQHLSAAHFGGLFGSLSVLKVGSEMLEKLYEIIDDIQFLDNTWEEAQREKQRLKNEIHDVIKIAKSNEHMKILRTLMTEFFVTADGHLEWGQNNGITVKDVFGSEFEQALVPYCLEGTMWSMERATDNKKMERTSGPLSEKSEMSAGFEVELGE